VEEEEEDAQKSNSGAIEGLPMWRSKWYDMFLVQDRIDAMRCIWGMMAYLMRKVDSGNGQEGEGARNGGGGGGSSSGGMKQ